ncbi:MAG: NAD(P)H-dependent oxidoreductase [Thermodesulfobacteriota bacterium]
MNKILVIFAHPAFEKSKVNLELCKAVKDLEGVTFRDLYEIYPDFLIDVKEEQKLLLEHDVIVLQHPFYWYSCPALMKEWIDLVLEYGFAYGHGGSALVGKLMMNAITTGGSEESYSQQGVHYYNVGEFLKVFERTAALCGMNYIPPFVVHQSSDLKSHEDISVYSDLYQKVILTLRDTTLDIRSLSEFQYINEYILDQFESWSV